MGIFSSKQQLDIICCGLDNSGKSTIINFLKPTKQRSDNISATVGYDVEEFTKGAVNLKVYDMGGAKKFRNLWELYYKDVQGIIFVIDSSDKIRMCHVREELRLLLQQTQSKPVPILFFSNKMDVPNARSPQEIVDELELTEMVIDRPYNIYPSNATKGINLEEGINWLTKQLTK